MVSGINPNSSDASLSPASYGDSLDDPSLSSAELNKKIKELLDQIILHILENSAPKDHSTGGADDLGATLSALFQK